MKSYVFFLLFFSFQLSSQNPTQIIKKSIQIFSKSKSYTNDVNFKFEIPGVNIKDVAGKSYYKYPDNYRVKVTGVAFIPNENPMKIYNYLRDSSYNALYQSTDIVQGQKCYLINIIPNKENYFIIGKLWISATNSCIYKIELTTNSGTIKLENYYKQMTEYGLPDKMIFYLKDMKRTHGNRKVGGTNRNDEEIKTEKPGTITMFYTNYKTNVFIPDTVFTKGLKLKKEKTKEN